MAGQNRSSYARSNGANRGLAAFFRGAFILLVALTLSFGLGFFVIARMLPNTANEGSGSNSTGGGASGGASGASHSDRRVQSSAPSSQIAVKPSSPAPPPQNGPVLLPDENIQKPDKLEAGDEKTSSSSDDAESPESTKTHSGTKSEDDSAGSTTTASRPPGETGETPNGKHSRRGRTPGTESGAVQSASSPDSAGSPASDSSRSATSDNPQPAKAGIYRVQIGVYSTREKAEEVARSAADKGIPTTLHVITRDGRTLYRVQQSTHRDRTKAELDRQKLIDAGFDATIINPL